MMLLHLAGHSGAGKTRLLNLLPGRGVTAPRAVLYTSRPPRQAEVHGRDYYFLSRGAVAALPRESFFVGPVREQLQAADLVQLEEDLRGNPLVLVEIHPTLWTGLRKAMVDRLGGGLQAASVFMTAVDPEAVRAMPDNDARGRYIKGEIEKSLTWRAKDSSSSIARRAASAVGEILEALGLDGRRDYDRVLYSSPEGPDGQDDWTRGEEPVGRARRTLDEFVAFVRALDEPSDAQRRLTLDVGR